MSMTMSSKMFSGQPRLLRHFSYLPLSPWRFPWHDMLLELCGLSSERGTILKTELSRKNRRDTRTHLPETKQKHRVPTLQVGIPLWVTLFLLWLSLSLCPLRKDSAISAAAPRSAPILNKLILDLLLSGEWQGHLRGLKTERETIYLNMSGEVGSWGADSEALRAVRCNKCLTHAASQQNGAIWEKGPKSWPMEDA